MPVMLQCNAGRLAEILAIRQSIVTAGPMGSIQGQGADDISAPIESIDYLIGRDCRKPKCDSLTRW
jgi:hypothetical protein